MDNSELINLLLSQLKERDNIIKSMADNVIKLAESNITKDKEKDKRHNNTVRISIISSLCAMCIIICVFICSYFFSDYSPTNAVYGNGNSTVLGNDNGIQGGED